MRLGLNVNVMADPVHNEHVSKDLDVFRYTLHLVSQLREVINKKKNGKKAVRLTAWVDPPLPSPEAVRKM